MKHRAAKTPTAGTASRRTLLRAAVGVAGFVTLPAVLGACATDNSSDRYDTGFVEGAGVAREIPAKERTTPLAFSAETYTGKKFDLAALRGKPVVLNVWYAACAPCRKEAPELASLAEKYAPKGVQFIGVNVRDEAGPAQAFEKNYKIPYPSVPDEDGSVMYALRGQVAPNAVPSTLVIDAQGRAAARISGAADPSILSAMIDRVLGE